MKTHSYGLFPIVCASTLACLSSQSLLAAPAYMNDADVDVPPTLTGYPSLSGHTFPRTMMAETQSMAGTTEEFSKYQIIATGGGTIKKVASIQSMYPDLMYFRQLNAPEYLDGGGTNCLQGHGMPFGGTAAASGNCNIFAGHWLYQAGTTTKQAMTATATSVQVADASRFTVGSYVVIYNAPAGSFGSAEHAKVTARNTSNNTLTLQRAYKSSAKSHASGSIIAQHALGQGGFALNWSFNMSSQCPKDANGKTYAAAMIDFIKSDYNTDQNGTHVNIKVSGFVFDSDFHFILANKLADANNDLVRDDGVSASGTNWWGDGMDAFYVSMRNSFPGKYVVAGHQLARGFAGINGGQMEGWPQSNGYHSLVPEYKDVSSRMSDYAFYMHEINKGPLNSHVLTKTPTKSYPQGTSASSDAPFRFALGLGLMQNGYFATQNSSKDPDPWYDEFAVDVNPASAKYGQAVQSNPQNEAAVRANRGWLGNPLGAYQRIYDATAFSASQSLITPATFDSDINGWSGSNVSVSRDTSTAQDGSGSLKTSAQQKYNANLSGAQVKGPTANLTKGTWYTLAFSARSNVAREIKANVGGYGERFLTGPTWRRYLMAFQATATGSQRISFAMGQETSPVALDSVYLFKGNPNLFRRDFDRGIVVANATSVAQYVTLGGTYQRIKGFQDPSVNNGATVTAVTIPPWDAAILVRPKNAVAATTTSTSTTSTTNSTTGNTSTTSSTSSSSGTTASTIDVCGKPNYLAGQDAGLFVWKDCGADTWRMRVTAGGNASGITYTGAISSTGGFSLVNQVNFESSDALNMSATRIDYSMYVFDSGADGINFAVPAGSKACFQLQSPASAQIFLGPKAVKMPMSFDLNSLKSCGTAAAANLSVVQAIYFAADNSVWIKADSTATPSGSSVITAALVTNGTRKTLGQVSWKSGKNAYQQLFSNVNQAPDTVVLNDTSGGSASAVVRVE